MAVELLRVLQRSGDPRACARSTGTRTFTRSRACKRWSSIRCVSSTADGKQALEDAKQELALITGQKPAETRSKKSIANFKLREHQAIGAKVTLRGARMYEFLERLIKTALPRIRDFRGVSDPRL